MITFFATPKPFRGHIRVIQRNAIQSWQRLHSDAEILLLGPEEGTAETAKEFGLRHEPDIPCNEFGTVILSGLFSRAREIAHHKTVCFINCDIILTNDFLRAVRAVSGLHDNFLMAGRRWDMPIAEPIDFNDTAWGVELRFAALHEGHQRPPQWIDYFLFRRDLFTGEIPAFAVGRPGYDNWLIWRARSLGIPVIDASHDVIAVHQNHDYKHHPGGEKGVWEGEEARRNTALLGGWSHFCTVQDAKYRLVAGRLLHSYRHWPLLAQRAAKHARSTIWFGALDATRPIRHRLDLRREQTPDSAKTRLPDEDSASVT
jgi:hypothetical protein